MVTVVQLFWLMSSWIKKRLSKAQLQVSVSAHLYLQPMQVQVSIMSAMSRYVNRNLLIGRSRGAPP